MRDINRLHFLYGQLEALHYELPDWRFMQLILNFMSWHMEKYGSNGFYLEDDVFMRRIEEFVDSMFVHYTPQKE